MRVLVRLCQICNRRNAPFRIIRGTLTHDYFQLQNYLPLETEYPVFRVITNAVSEELLPGFIVLWMPEEYPTDYSDYYSGFFFNEEGEPYVYDAVFLHGEIDVAAGWSRASEGERHYGGTPCHEASFLLEHTTGPVWAGHVHTRFRHKRRLGYPGSLTRWCHGEEAPKGFDVLDVSRGEGGEWSTVVASVVQNDLAREYRTVSADEILSASDTVDSIVGKIRDAAEPVHRLRVKMGDFPIGVEELSLVRGALLAQHSIELVMAARASASQLDTGDDANEDGAEERPGDPMSYLRDQGIPGEERLLRYLHERSPGMSGVTVDDVRELTAPLA